MQETLNQEEIVEKLERAMEDQDDVVLGIVVNICADEMFEELANRYFNNLIWNESNYGWGFYGFGAKEYARFIDDLYDNYALKDVRIWDEVRKEIRKAIKDILPNEDIEWYESNYGRNWEYEAVCDYLEEIKERKNASALVNFVAPIVEKHVKNRVIDIVRYWWENIFSFEELEYYSRNLDAEDVINLAKKYGYYDELVSYLSTY